MAFLMKLRSYYNPKLWRLEPHLTLFVGKYMAVTTDSWSSIILGAAQLPWTWGVTGQVCSLYLFTSWLKISPMAALCQTAIRVGTWSGNIRTQTHSCKDDPKAVFHTRKKRKLKNSPTPPIKYHILLQQEGFLEKLVFFLLSHLIKRGSFKMRHSLVLGKKTKPNQPPPLPQKRQMLQCAFWQWVLLHCFKHAVKV